MLRGVCAGTLGVVLAVAVTTGAGAASWGPPVAVSPDGVDVASASAALTSDGTRVLALGVPDGENGSGLRLGTVAPGAAAPGPATILSGGPSFAWTPVADGSGAAAVLWTAPATGVDSGIHLTTRTADGTVSSVVLPADIPAVTVAMGDGGDVAVAWVATEGDEQVVRTAVRRAGDAAFGPATSLLRGTPAGGSSGSVALAVLDGGDVVATWVRDPGTTLLGGVSRGGVVRAPQALTSGRWAQRVTLTADGARALVSWIEGASDDQFGPRDVRLAVATASGLGPITTIGTGRQSSDGDAPVVAARAGHAVLAWSSAYYDDLGNHGLGARTVDVDLLTGVATGSVPVTEANEFDPQVYASPAALSIAPDGRALLALDQYAPAVAERAAGVREFRNPVPVSCRAGTSLLVGYEGGVPTVTWSDQYSVAAVRRVFVSRRDATAAQTCPRFGRSPFANPEQPHVGEDTTFDASGEASADAPTEYSWDLDGDGVFELDWADRPVVHHTFTTTGDHMVHVNIRYRTPRGYEGGGGWLIRVIGVLPPVDGASTTGPGIPAVTPAVRAPTAAGTVAIPTRAPARGTITAPRSILASTLARRGVQVRVRAPRAGTLRAVASGSGFRTLRATRRVQAERTTTLRLRPKRTRRCRTRSVALRLRVTVPGSPTLTRTTTVRCRG